MGDFVGLMTYGWHFAIFNWKTGRQIVKCDDDPQDAIDDFFFLDDTRYILTRGDRNPAELEVYQISPTGAGSSPPVLVAIYQLPKMAGKLAEINCRSDPPPFATHPGDPNTPPTVFSPLPFVPRLEDRAVVIRMAVETLEAHADYTLICRAETLLRTPAASSHELRQGVSVPIVESRSWMRDTHLSKWPFDNDFACFVYGSRILLQPPTAWTPTTQGRMVVMIDCNPANIAKVRSLRPDDAPGSVRDTTRYRVPKPSHQGADSFLAEGWGGEMPTMMARVLHENKEPVRASMVDGEHLLTVHLVGIPLDLHSHLIDIFSAVLLHSVLSPAYQYTQTDTPGDEWTCIALRNTNIHFLENLRPGS